MIELAGNLVVEDGEILLLHRADENWWELPGGKLEDGESPTEAAKREAEEELGVKVDLERPFFSGEFMHEGELYLWHAYISTVVEGEPGLEEDKFSKMEWFKGSELDELELAPNLEQILPALRKI